MSGSAFKKIIRGLGARKKFEKKASKTESGFTWIKDLPLTELEKPEVIAKD